MTARILDGKTTSAQIRSEVAERVQALSDKGIIPGLAAVLVGEEKTLAGSEVPTPLMMPKSLFGFATGCR